jgi:hypothetical protein
MPISEYVQDRPCEVVDTDVDTFITTAWNDFHPTGCTCATIAWPCRSALPAISRRPSLRSGARCGAPAPGKSSGLAALDQQKQVENSSQEDGIALT